MRSQTLSLPGLQHAVTVSFTAQGVPSVRAASDHDMFLALGYVHAQFRLAEMDEERRLGEGRLAQPGGPADLASDQFELRLGLLRTAQEEWAQMPKDSLAAQALTAYAQGVNAWLAQVRASGQWPAAFSMVGVYPGPWTPVDSLVVQGELTQELTSPPPRWTTRCSSAPSEPPAPWTGSRSSRKTRRPPTTQARTPSSR